MIITATSTQKFRVIRESDGCWRANVTRPMSMEECKQYLRTRGTASMTIASVNPDGSNGYLPSYCL